MIQLRTTIRSVINAAGGWVEHCESITSVQELLKSLKPRSSPKLYRIGAAQDGGYLLPDDFRGIAACISPGVSQEVGFDLSIAEMGIAVHMLDASVLGPPITHEKFHFTQKYLDIYESKITTTLDEFCGTHAPSGDLLLQMDIEGAEYRVLTAVSPMLLARFRVMIIEFHDFDRILSISGYREISAIVSKLGATHAPVHVHVNNAGRTTTRGPLKVPSLVEFTFLRKDRFEGAMVPTIPNHLDAENVQTRPPMAVPYYWRSEGPDRSGAANSEIA